MSGERGRPRTRRAAVRDHEHGGGAAGAREPGTAAAGRTEEAVPPSQAIPPFDAVLVAAGSSRRMGGIDKLLEDLGGRPIVRWSLEALAEAGAERIVVVTSADRVPAIAAAEWLPDAVVAVVAGGARRQESVAAGVAALVGLEPPVPLAPLDASDPLDPLHGAVAAVADRVVLVHDAARPLATPRLVRAVAGAAARHGAAIPVLPVAETLKRVDGEWVGETIDRTSVAAAQTPQGVRLGLLARAYGAWPPDGDREWTDEAALLEACRIPVHAIDGEPANLKVTVPGDLDRARALVAHAERELHEPAATPRAAMPPFRVGFGTDTHPFGAAAPLVLGGVAFPDVPRLVGHSDGDAALHAVCDALLGAASLGDLGRLYPADASTPRGIDSAEMLRTVVARLAAAGWSPSSADLTIVAARPRLAARLPEMADRVASLLGLPAGAVNVKASTGNLEGAEGSGRSVTAHAVAVVTAAVPNGEGELPA